MALNTYNGIFSYKDIGLVANITVPADTASPFSETDIGKPLTYGTDGYKVAGDGDAILGFLYAVSVDGEGTMATKGLFLAECAAAIAPGTLVKGAANGTVQAITIDTANGIVDTSKCMVVAPVDATHVWVTL